MRRDSPLAQKETVSPEDLLDKPLILSQQEDKGGSFSQWMKQDISDLNIVATYNLLFNASLMVEEGFGYAVGLDKIINTGGRQPNSFPTSISSPGERNQHYLEEIPNIFQAAGELYQYPKGDAPFVGASPCLFLAWH